MSHALQLLAEMAVSYQQSKEQPEDATAATKKEDTVRALSILKELLTTAEEEPEESEDEDVLSALSRVQSVVDTLESPLFSSLLEIRDQYLKETLNLQKGQVQLSLDNEADLLTDFCQRYDISRRSSISSSYAERVSLRKEPLLPANTSGSNQRKFDESIVLYNEGATTPERTFGGNGFLDLSSVSTESSADVLTAELAAATLGGVERKGSGRRKKGSRGKQYLLHLDNGKDREESLFSLRDSSPSPSASDQGRSKGTGSDFRFRHSSESSLSSYSVSSESSQHAHLHKTVSPSSSSNFQGENVDTSHLSHDMLFPMRDRPTNQRIQKVLHGQLGREQRQVRLTQPASCNLGLDIIGLSHMGLFVSQLTEGGVAERCGLLQIGDQILELNGASCGLPLWETFVCIIMFPGANMASFELLDQLENTAVGDDIVLSVQHNPSGFAEYLRQHSYQ